ncbi:hypothetical protein CGMCC3_g11228 [Colletotrichum fructicola]|uniref:Uncharacterized protein n=1 Tax=Colletotrichum fructicola (strain Nara gc5) TaxID=1213859 RepID=A0A7J6JGK7_COLFN|nr:uncharacterized protein CGMCC3_g11228 [Colletotrichum fructicola]KAE9572776.1 hypothetical protein CGMCC3_g11228 [Colletotrichum fructicola]KAF4488843.1 hypothetical protein CGGC5_v003181 [Colletotrichum fructicola Nara gc5]KAF4906099.1 hypothetical protein CGCFRS4_v000454 [Colletotrichum fructicola]
MDSDSKTSTGFSAVLSTKSFAPLLIDDSSSLGKKTARSKRRCADLGSKLWNKRAWKEAVIAAVQDLIDFNWVIAISWLFLLGWIAGLGVLMSVVIQQPQTITDSDNTACQPDGSFNIFMNEYDWWAASGFFQITMAWGTMTFANAKFVDVAWDVVFGRGGQALLAWISWSIFSDYVTTSMEVSPVTYETFWTVFLDGSPTFWSTWYLMRDFSRSHGLRSRFAMVFMVVVAIFILLFPTLGSAMSGYQANSGAFIRGADGEMLKFSDFDMIVYIIHDGDRVNLTKDYPVTFARSNYDTEQLLGNTLDGYYPNSWYSWSYYGSSNCEEDQEYSDEERNKQWQERYPLNCRCSLHGSISNYTKEHGFFGLKNNNSTFMNQTLSSPTLNISAFYLPERYRTIFGNNWTDPRTNTQPFSDRSKVTYTYNMGNETYDLNYIKSNGTCQPVTEIDKINASARETYQWGFSYIQLFIMLLLLILWTLGMSAMWVKSHMTMRMRSRFDKPKGFKGVLELAAAIRKELQESNPDDLTHDQLSEEIKKRLRGGTIELEKAGSPVMYGVWGGLWGWIKNWRWWTTTWCLLTAIGSLLITYKGGVFLWIMILSASIFFAMVIGRSSKSMAMLSLWGFVLGIIIWVAVMSALQQRGMFDMYY